MDDAYYKDDDTVDLLDFEVLDEVVDEWIHSAPIFIVLCLVFITFLSFYGQGIVTVERFIPPLNFIANKLKLSDDVAGSTLMAAGGSSPELFTCFVTTFLTQTSLGMGCIVGSEIFNHLVICAAAVLSAKSGSLQLRMEIVLREVIFYGISILLLLIVISDRRANPDTGVVHIYIHFWGSLFLVIFYLVYILVCTHFDSVLSVLGRDRNLSNNIHTTQDEPLSTPKVYDSPRKLKFLYNSVQVPPAPFIKQIQYEPSMNFENDDDTVVVLEAAPDCNEGSVASTMYELREWTEKEVPGTVTAVQPSQDDLGTGCVADFVYCQVLDNPLQILGKPSKLHDLYTIEENPHNKTFSAFMWHRTNFYNKAKSNANAYQLRWFTFYHNKIESVPDRVKGHKYSITYPKFHSVEVDEDHLMIKLHNIDRSGRNYIFMVPSKTILGRVLSHCSELMDFWAEESEGLCNEDTREIFTTDSQAIVAEAKPSLISYPAHSSILNLSVYFILLPFHALVHLTIPDIQRYDHNANNYLTIYQTAIIASVMSVVWLIFLSCVMVWSLEYIGELLNIPDAVMGMTVSAAGTSVPPLFGSIVAARQGLGNMAVSNAFGSNTFNIMIGLGLPWFLYTAYDSEDGIYHALKDEGITLSCGILGATLLVFQILVYSSGYTLHKWHAYLFLGLYAVFIVYVLLSVR